MYDHTPPAPLGPRDVIAAWLVCLAVAVAVFANPGFLAKPAREAQTAVKNTTEAIARAGSRIASCAPPNRQVGEKHG